jgi:hypothetical protein
VSGPDRLFEALRYYKNDYTERRCELIKSRLLSLEELTGIEVACTCGMGVIVPINYTSPESITGTMKPTCSGCGRSLGGAVMAAEVFSQFLEHVRGFVREQPNRKVSIHVTEK